MNPNDQPLTSQTTAPHPILRIMLPVTILVIGIGVAVLLIKTRRPPRKRAARERVTVVDVRPLQRGPARIFLEAAGTVVPRTAISLQARVAGEVIAVDPRFVPGGRFAQGELLLEIDPTDYRLTATNRLADLRRARANLDIEQGLQEVAVGEWDMMQGLESDRAYTDADRDLALRVPQRKLAEAAVMTAQAAVDRALLDIERTRVRAPFNAVIRERNVAIGAQASLQSVLAELAETDAYWVSITLPAAQMKWIPPLGPGTNGHHVAASIRAVAGAAPSARWDGRVLRALPDLEPRGRQAQLLVEVLHPWQPTEGSGPLTLGAYVEVRIEGPTIKDVFEIPRSAVRDQDRIWLLGEDNRLAVRDVAPVWTDATRALIRDGLREGERLIVSDISMPVPGMLLRTAAAVDDAGQPLPPAGADDE